MGSGYSSSKGDGGGGGGTAGAGSADNREVSFNSFNILRAIGRGAFGKVCIVQLKNSRRMFAMKYMNKLACIEKDSVSNVLREVKILAALDFPYLVNLWFTFQDVEDMFVVVDLLLGGDLRYHIQHGVRFNEDAVRLALAQMALTLDYLRNRRILHRDIKPDNLIFDEFGNLHLTDFNVATVLHDGSLATSVAGTKPYMAPEMFQTSLRQVEGYSFPADWWSLGMTLYEMHRLKRPYELPGDMSPVDCLSRIQSAGIRYSTSTSAQLRTAIQALLEPNPGLRLCSLAALKAHPFTRHLDWDRILAKAEEPAFRPPRHQLNCDPTFELEEMIIEAKPLHKKHKRLSKLGSSSDRSSEDNPTARALADIEAKFPVFNREVLLSDNSASSTCGAENALNASATNTDNQKH